MRIENEYREKTRQKRKSIYEGEELSESYAKKKKERRGRNKHQDGSPGVEISKEGKERKKNSRRRHKNKRMEKLFLSATERK